MSLRDGATEAMAQSLLGLEQQANGTKGHPWQLSKHPDQPWYLELADAALDALLDYLTVELGKVEGWKIRAEYWTAFDLLAALRRESDQ